MRGHIRKRGNSYSVVFDIGRDENGKRRQKWVSGFKTKKEAEKYLAEVISKIEKGSFVLPNNATLKEYLLYWLENYAKPNLSPTTVAGYEIITNKHIIPYFGDILLQKLLPIHFAQYFKDKSENLSQKTLLQHYRMLHRALEMAVKYQLIEKNPLDNVDPPKPQKYKPRVLTIDEINLLFEKLKGTDLEVPIHVALALGLRRGELLGLKWEDINWEEGTIHIRKNLVRANTQVIHKSPKSETSERILKVPDTILKLLKQHYKRQLELKLQKGKEYKDNGFVFCKDDGSYINPSTFSHKFADFLKKHGLPDIRLHDLRHTNATLMLKSNIPAKIASKRLGHSTITITLDLYSHVLQDMDEEVANKIDDMLYKK